MEGIVLNVLVRQGLELLHVNEVDFQCVRQKAVPVGILPEMEHGMEIIHCHSLKIYDVDRNHIGQQTIVLAFR